MRKAVTISFIFYIFSCGGDDVLSEEEKKAQAQGDMTMIQLIMSEELELTLMASQFDMLQDESATGEGKNVLTELTEGVTRPLLQDIEAYKNALRINPNDEDSVLKLLAINFFKNEGRFDIQLVFDNNKIIELKSEIIECVLEDQNKKNAND